MSDEIVVYVERPQEVKSSWGRRLWTFARTKVFSPVPFLLLVSGVGFILALVFKGKIGGALGSLLKKGQPNVNTIPEKRVRPDGTPIQQGEPDSKGVTQAVVVPLKKPGLLDDSSVIQVTDPTTGKDTPIVVPEGVDARSIDTVVVVKPEVKTATVKSTSTVSTSRVSDLLKKYR